MSGRVTFLIITCHMDNWQTFIYLHLLPVCLRGHTHVYQLYNFTMLQKEREHCNKTCHVQIWISQFKFRCLLKIYDIVSPNSYFNLKVKQNYDMFLSKQALWNYMAPWLLQRFKGFYWNTCKKTKYLLMQGLPIFSVICKNNHVLWKAF